VDDKRVRVLASRGAGQSEVAGTTTTSKSYDIRFHRSGICRHPPQPMTRRSLVYSTWSVYVQSVTASEGCIALRSEAQQALQPWLHLLIMSCWAQLATDQ
jgi:hypothetical protein